MRISRLLSLFTIGLILFVGGAAFAKEGQKIAFDNVFTIDQVYEAPAMTSVISFGVVSLGDANFIFTKTTILNDHFTFAPIVLEVRDPDRLHDLKAINRNNPGPKKLKAQKLIRRIFKHPSSI